MDVELSVDQNNTLNRIAKEEGFDGFDITTSPGSAKGDNYLGTITRLCLKDHSKKLDLILKTASKSLKLRETLSVREAYLREIDLYETVLPAFEKFLINEGCSGVFTGHPKIYGSCRKDLEEFVILENLKEAGYDLWDRKKPMDWDHVALVLKEYGKFHAISLAMKEKNPDLFEELTKNLTVLLGVSEEDKVEDVKVKEEKKEEGEKRTKMIIDGTIKAVKSNQTAVAALERLSPIAYRVFHQDAKAPEDRLVVMHGDCWCNNFLFKYKDPQSKKPSKVSVIDWQMSALGSPAKDLAYFLFTCAPKNILADHERFLKVYHDAACETLRAVGCDPETTYPFGLLETHWRKYVKFGMLMAIVMLKAMLSEGEEVPDMAEIAEAGANIADGFTYESVNDLNYNRRILDAVLVCADNGWL